MFGRIFGNPAEKSQEAPKVDLMQMQEIDSFYDLLKVLEKRSRVLIMSRNECRDEAIKAKEAGDLRTAWQWLQRMKVLDKDVAQTEVELLLRLEQRKSMLEGSFSGEGVN